MKVLYSKFILSLGLSVSSAFAVDCTCQDKDGDNTFTIQGFQGSDCSKLIADINSTGAVKGKDSNGEYVTPLTGKTECKIKGGSDQNCEYQLSRIHMATCTTAK